MRSRLYVADPQWLYRSSFQLHHQLTAPLYENSNNTKTNTGKVVISNKYLGQRIDHNTNSTMICKHYHTEDRELSLYSKKPYYTPV